MAEIDHDSGRAAPTSTAHILYVLHALSPFTLWSLSVVAVIIGAITRDTVRGTWVESHYAWLLRTLPGRNFRIFRPWWGSPCYGGTVSTRTGMTSMC